MFPRHCLRAILVYTFFVCVTKGVNSTYLGCFREKSTSDRLLKGDRVDFVDTLTKDKCMSYCSSNGFSYIGLQFKYECYCSKYSPSEAFSTNDAECDMQCDGNNNEKCGGALRLSVHSVDEGFVPKYIGCYKDRSIESRLMPEEQKDFKDTLTPGLCVNHCKNKGYTYAGLQYNYQCFCTNTRPSFMSAAHEKDCNAPCDGDKSEICGGGFRLSVYETSAVLENFVESNYLGCYSETNTNKLLNGNYRAFRNSLTPERCVGFCYLNGFRFAGVQNGTDCYCGNSLDDNNKVTDSECSTKCGTNSIFICGGNWRNSVYHTQISDYSEDGRLVGCFIDNGNLRILSGHSTGFPDTNTPKLCLNICLQMGYKFSGVQYGSECFCGDRRPGNDKEVAEIQCSMPCPGDRRKKCGGNWRILVFSTNSSLHPQTLVTSRPIEGITKRPSPLQLSTSSSLTSVGTIGTTKPNCVRSQTEVNRKIACKGEMLFKEDFVNDISLDKWTYDIKMPWIPDYEFVVLDKNSQNLFVKNGKLHIRPTLQDDDFVKKGKLDLQGCTGTPFSEECARQAASFSILPPLRSARITTRNSISFKYGIVQVRAKLPVGDWIVPEIWLEPKDSVYGPAYASGRIRIAMARGNKNLISGDQDIGNRLLESGILMGVGENIRGRTVSRDNSDGWYRHFHNYTLIWTPDNLKFAVDGQFEETLVSSGANLADLVEFDQNTLMTWKHGSKIAPFDQEFYLSLGVSVGGMRDFPDESMSSGQTKPWTNMAVKAMVNFWQARNKWKAGWDEVKSGLQIEHAWVKAL